LAELRVDRFVRRPVDVVHRTIAVTLAGDAGVAPTVRLGSSGSCLGRADGPTFVLPAPACATLAAPLVRR
jgi:hypothetical protein